MTTQETFILANEELKKIVGKIRDEQWPMDMPEDFPSFDKSRTYTLREIINYHTYDDAWVPDMLDGKTLEEAGKNKFDGDLLGNAPKENYVRYADKAIAAVRDLDDLEQTVHFSYGDFPAWDALQHITLFRGLRVYDISKALGLNTAMPDDLVEGLWTFVEPNAEEWRAMGIFGPKIDVAEGAPLQDRLLGLTGREL